MLLFHFDQLIESIDLVDHKLIQTSTLNQHWMITLQYLFLHFHCMSENRSISRYNHIRLIYSKKLLFLLTYCTTILWSKLIYSFINECNIILIAISLPIAKTLKCCFIIFECAFSKSYIYRWTRWTIINFWILTITSNWFLCTIINWIRNMISSIYWAIFPFNFITVIFNCFV